MLLVLVLLSTKPLQIVGEGAVLVYRGWRDSEGGSHFLLVLSPVIISNGINRPAMGPKPKNLSHIQQGWRHRTYTEVECVTGRIPETQSSSKQVFISVDRLLGQKDGIIDPSSPPVAPISREKSVNLVCPFDWTVPHLAGREGSAQILANPRMRSQGRSALKTQRSLSIFS